MMKMKKMIMMMMIIILKTVPALWGLKSVGGNKVSPHVAMASPWDTCSSINVPCCTVTSLSPKNTLLISQPPMPIFLSILISLLY